MKNSLRCFTALAPLVIGPAVFAELPLAAGTKRPATVVTSTPFGPPATSIEHDRDRGRPGSQASSIEHRASSIQHTIGDRLLLEAASRLERRRSVTARLRHQATFQGEQLFGVGSYWQEGRGDQLKVRWELQIAGQDSRLLQVSNSRFRWLDCELPVGRTVTRVDLRQLRAVLAAPGSGEIRPGEASWSPSQMDVTAICGGLPRLLATLTENFNFLPPQAMRLVPAQGGPATGVPLFAVVGHWKSEKLAALVGSQPSPARQGESPAETGSQSPAAISQPPGRIPQEVLLLVDQTDLFPYRIEFRALESRQTVDSTGRPVPYQLSQRPIVVLEFSNVVFDIPIAAGHFDYAPPTADWVDQTDDVLEKLRRQRQAKIAGNTSTQPQPLPPR
jgi:hypothetical protein